MVLTGVGTLLLVIGAVALVTGFGYAGLASITGGEVADAAAQPFASVYIVAAGILIGIVGIVLHRGGGAGRPF